MLPPAEPGWRIRVSPKPGLEHRAGHGDPPSQPAATGRAGKAATRATANFAAGEHQKDGCRSELQAQATVGSTGRRRSSSGDNRPLEEADHHTAPRRITKGRYRVASSRQTTGTSSSKQQRQDGRDGSSTRALRLQAPLRWGGARPHLLHQGGEPPWGRWPKHVAPDTAATASSAPPASGNRQQGRQGRASQQAHQHASAAPPARATCLGQVELEAAIKEHRLTSSPTTVSMAAAQLKGVDQCQGRSGRSPGRRRVAAPPRQARDARPSAWARAPAKTVTPQSSSSRSEHR